MEVIVTFEVDLSVIEAELEAQMINKTQENVQAVVNEIKVIAKGVCEDTDMIYSAIDNIFWS